MANARETRGRCWPLGAGREGGGREAALDSSPVSFTHTYLPLPGSLGHQQGQTRMREEPDQQAQELLGPGWGCGQRRELKGSEVGILLVKGLVYSPCRLETGG